MRGRLLPLLAVVLLTACDDGGGDLDAYCATAERFAADNPAAVFERVDPADPAAAAPLLRDAADRLGAWADEAPDEIDGDVEVLADAAAALAEQFEAPRGVGETDDDVGVDVAAAEAASARVIGFTSAECGVELEPASP